MKKSILTLWNGIHWTTNDRQYAWYHWRSLFDGWDTITVFLYVIGFLVIINVILSAYNEAINPCH